MKYLLDFDRTLMDTDRLGAAARLEEKLHLVGTPDFWDHYQATDFLYADVLAWLRAKDTADVHILTAYKPSQGELAKLYQEGKIGSGGFSDHVGGVTVMDGQKGPVAAAIAKQWLPSEPIVFVDDLLEQCLSVKEALPEAHCFLMCRGGARVEALLPPGLTTVCSLLEVDVIMDKLV